VPDDLPVSVNAAGGAAPADEPALPAFYLDLASPACYLAAERILTTMPVPVEWVPIHFAPPPPDDDERRAIAAAARDHGLQAVRWPPPFDAERANLTATYAKSIGRTVAFALAALRQAYAGGRPLDTDDNIVIAASACEMHPTAVLKTITTRGPRRALETATATARERGVTSTPAIWVPPAPGTAPGALGRTFHGDERLEDAAAVLGERTV